MVTRADMRNRLRWELGDETQPYVWKDLELNEYIDSSVQLLTTHVPRTRCRVVNPDPADGAYYLPEDCIGPPWRVDMDGQVLPPSAYFLPDDHILMLEPMGTRGVRPIAVTYPACVFPPGTTPHPWASSTGRKSPCCGYRPTPPSAPWRAGDSAAAS